MMIEMIFGTIIFAIVISVVTAIIIAPIIIAGVWLQDRVINRRGVHHDD